jgi:hypothetical protein
VNAGVARTLIIAGLFVSGVSACSWAQSVDTVRAGRKVNAARAFAARTDTVDSFIIQGTNRTRVETWTVQYDVTPAGNFVRRYVDNSQLLVTVMKSGTLMPVRFRAVAAQDSVDISFGDEGAQGWSVPGGASWHSVDTKLDVDDYPLIGSEEVLAALPLRDKYSALVRSFDAYAGRLGWKSFRVIRSDTTTYRDGRARVWVVEETNPNTPGRPPREYWVDMSTRRILRSRGGFPPAGGGERWNITR